MGTVDSSGCLLVLAGIGVKERFKLELKQFPLNILSFETMNGSNDDVIDRIEKTAELEANLRFPPFPFQCATRELGLHAQLNLVDKITSMVDELRKVERPLRTDVLKYNLVALDKTLNNSCYFDPIGIAGEPLYKLVRILIEDCRVFRTKARAPSMIVIVVERIDAISSSNSSSNGNNNSKNDHVPSSPPSLTRRPSASLSKPRSQKAPSYDEVEVGNILGSKISQTIADLHENEKRLAETADEPPPTPIDSEDHGHASSSNTIRFYMRYIFTDIPSSFNTNTF